MKDLNEYIKESLLDLDDDTETIIDKKIKDPFKYFVNIPNVDSMSVNDWKQEFQQMGMILAGMCKVKTPEKSTNAKYKIGFNLNTRLIAPNIYIKCDGKTYAMRPNPHNACKWDISLCTNKARAQNWISCETVYVADEELIDKFRELYKHYMGNASKKLYADRWEAWEKYKKS